MSGERIEHYELRERIGLGGMGSVHRAWDPRAGREVAIKLLSHSGDSQRRRFQREAQVLASLRHRNVVTVQAAGETERGQPYLVMDLVEGPSLEAVLEEEGPLSIRRAVEISWHLAQALAHAHERGILHRDLKPANVLLAEDGRPLLTDFGLAKELDASRSRLTKSGHSMGTPGFWPPEQAGGDQGAVGPASDVYGLGAILYALLTGEPPIQGDSLVELMTATLSKPPTPPSALRREVDPLLEGIVLRCLEKDPARRYPSAEALADALDGWLIGARQGRKTWPAVIAGSGLAAAVLLAGAALLPTGTSPATPPAAEPRPGPDTPASDPESPAPEAAATAPQLWSAEGGRLMRYRLTRRTERAGGSQATFVELILTQRVVERGRERAIFELDVERITLRNVQNGMSVFDYDSTQPAPANQRALEQRVQQLLVSHPQITLDPRSGQLHELGGVPTLTPPNRERDPITDIRAAVLGVISNQGVYGCLQTLWHVVPPDSAGESWQVAGQVWPAGGVGYVVSREFKPRGERIVVGGHAKSKDAIIGSGLNRNYQVGNLEVRGSVRFSDRGLEESSQKLSYEVVVGDYPGPRTTTLEFERLD